MARTKGLQRSVRHPEFDNMALRDCGANIAGNSGVLGVLHDNNHRVVDRIPRPKTLRIQFFCPQA